MVEIVDLSSEEENNAKPEKSITFLQETETKRKFSKLPLITTKWERPKRMFPNNMKLSEDLCNCSVITKSQKYNEPIPSISKLPEEIVQCRDPRLKPKVITQWVWNN